MSYVINNEINIAINTQGQAGLQNITTNIGQLTQTTIIYNAAAQQTTNRATSMRFALRRLAIDLRMIANGIRIVGSQFKDTAPAIATITNSIFVVASAFVGLIGVVNLYTNVQTMLATVVTAGTPAFAAIAVAIQNAGVVAVVGPYLLLAVAIIALINVIYNAVTGLGRMKQELKAVKDTIWKTTDAMQSLKIIQAELSVGTTGYSFRVQALELEIERQGFATEKQIALLKSLKSEYASGQLEIASYNQALASLQRTQLQDQQVKSRLDFAIENVNRDAIRRLFSSGQGAPSQGVTPKHKAILGGEVNRSGAINVEAGEVIMQKEQLATMLQKRGGGSISVTISMAGANINGVNDLEGTLSRGGARIRKELDKLMLMRDRR